MTTRKFHKTVYRLEVLSEEPVPDEMELEDILSECEDGGWSGDISVASREQLNGKEAAEALAAQRSDPAFFGLTMEGEDCSY